MRGDGGSVSCFENRGSRSAAYVCPPDAEASYPKTEASVSKRKLSPEDSSHRILQDR